MNTRTEPHAEAAAPSSPARPNGRPSAYSPELVHRILTLVRETGLAPTAAAEQAGLSRGTLSRWRQLHPNFDQRLVSARTEHRALHLGKIRPTTTRDGRPNWRTAAWELEQAFPEEYSMNPKRRAAYRAARDAEQAEWERIRAEFAREQAAADNAPAPPHLNPDFQPQSRSVPFTCAPLPASFIESTAQKFRNVSATAIRPSREAGVTTPEPAEKFQNPAVPADTRASADLSTAPRTPASPLPAASQKFQNPPCASELHFAKHVRQTPDSVECGGLTPPSSPGACPPRARSGTTPALRTAEKFQNPLPRESDTLSEPLIAKDVPSSVHPGTSQKFRNSPFDQTAPCPNPSPGATERGGKLQNPRAAQPLIPQHRSGQKFQNPPSPLKRTLFGSSAPSEQAREKFRNSQGWPRTSPTRVILSGPVWAYSAAEPAP